MGKKIRILLLVVCCLLFTVPQQVSAKDKEVNFNKSITILKKYSYTESGKYVWLKYKPNADGYLTIRAGKPKKKSPDAKGYLALYDSTKNRMLSSKSIFYHTGYGKNPYWNSTTFGMRKDQIYYIRVKAEGAVKFSGKFTKTNDQSGTSMTRALHLKKNKLKKGLIPAGVANEDWYKIKLDKRQTLHLYYSAETKGSFRISLYLGRNKRKIGVRNIYYTAKETKISFNQYNETAKKKTGMDPGDYYIKVERANNISSGYYRIRWN